MQSSGNMASNNNNNNSKKKLTLGGLFGKNNKQTPRGSAATIGGDRNVILDSKRNTTNDDDDSSRVMLRADGNKQRTVTVQDVTTKLGESSSIIVQPDGTKVRRVKKTYNNNNNNSNSGDEGEIVIRPDGKKVRRIRKVSRTNSAASLPATTGSSSANLTPLSSLTTTANSTLGGFLNNNNNVNDSSIVTSSQVYINAQGKKVRRVTRKKTGAATVAGSMDRGEIYVRPDGKKVRRVKRTTSSASLATPMSSKVPPTAMSHDLGGFLSNNNNNKAPISRGAATVAGGEIYINKDGKKVRRVRRGKEPSSLNITKSILAERDAAKTTTTRSVGEIYINKDGKKVRRVRRSKSGESLPPASNTNTNNQPSSSLDSMLGKASRPGLSGSATVIGGANHNTSHQEGEIYIRADGKKVRRVRRTPSTAQPAPLGGFFSTNKNKEASKKNVLSGSATVAGDRKLDGEIIVRPDGKKVIRRLKKNKTNDPNAEIYRRADGKLVRRVRRSASLNNSAQQQKRSAPPPTRKPSIKSKIPLNDAEEAIAVDYRKMLKMGLPDAAVKHKMTVSNVSEKIIAAVLNLEYKEPTKQQEPEKPPTVQLNSEEDDVADMYRKMLKMGLPEGAVRQKMQSNGVSGKIIANVLNEAYTEPEPTPPPTSGPQLSETQESEAVTYRKMKKMGLPDDVVRHKMIVSEVHPKIIASVLGEEYVEPKTAPPSTGLSKEDETIIEQYKKMLQMGLPENAVRHKMVLAQVDTKLIDAVFDTPSGIEQQPSEQQSVVSNLTTLSADEELQVNQYRKMRAMGLPDDAVRHKMIVNEIDPRVIAAVFGDDASPPDSDSASSPPVAGEQALDRKGSDGAVTAPNAVAYVVVVGDESAEQASSKAAANGDVTATISPDEKFAVKVADESNPHTPTKQTKFFTLEELSKMSGQDKSELEAIVSDKRKRGASPPRFSLLPLDEKKYEVAVPSASKPSPASTVPAQVPEGQEVVDSDLAKTARAVTALGETDMSALLAKLEAGDVKDLLTKLQEAEKRQKKLEKQLAQSGIAIAEDIDYQEAKVKVEEIAKRMNEIGGSDVTAADKEEQNRLREEYFKLEQQMERYNTALMMTEEYQAEQDRLERKWEIDNEPANIEALKKLRRHMPVNIRHLSEADLTTKPSPNGKYLPKPIAKKFKRTNVLQCLRLNPDDIECMHPATLENMRVTGLTLTERRALYIHLKPIGPKWEKNKAEKMTERKWTWYQMMKSNFKEALAPYQRHIDQYGPPDNHPYATRDNPNVGCPLIGKQCPVKADKNPSYDDDYGWTDEPVYEVSEVRKADVEDSGAKAMAEALELAREKKANERADLLKKHYKGKLLQVSKANGSCESMDESMDQMEGHIMRWIEFKIEKGENEAVADKNKEVAMFIDALNELKLKVLDFGQRSGMQMSGKRTAGGDKPDIRSCVEGSLAEEVYECSKEFFSYIGKRMKELAVHDSRVAKTIEMLEGMLSEIHERNVALLKKLDVKRMDRSRKLKKVSDIAKEVEDKKKPEEEAEEETSGGGTGPPVGGPGRGGLLADLAGGRGRGRGGGRGGLMDAIQGRGRGGRGGGGRGGLMDAIKGGRGKGPPGGGRGGLMDAIKGRGRGPPGGGGPGGGRGGLLAAIAARGGGGD